jgi:hypothetical protein
MAISFHKPLKVVRGYIVPMLRLVVYYLLLASPLAAQDANRHYGLRYDLKFNPQADRAEVALTLDKRIKGNIWSMRFHIDPDRHAGFQGDGEISVDGEYVTWSPPETGGRLSFQVPVSHRRDNGRLDAMMTNDWAIFRGDDLFPPARTDQHDAAEADATLHVELPERWSFVSPYSETEDNVYEIEHAHRSFDRPTGWMAAGRLGVRRELIAGTHVVVAGPLNQGARRMDILAILQWNLPRIRKVTPDMPERLLVVSAGDPMWRGGLSGPGSLFLHAERPMISENGTSTLVHELMHVANRLEAQPGADWIVEGLAEYYSLKIMWRSGTISDQRYERAFRSLARRGEDAGRLDVDVSRGPVTARAVGIMRRLDHEVYRKSRHEKSLDDVMLLLMKSGQKVSLELLQKAAAECIGEPAETLSDRQLGLTGSRT